MQDGLESQVCLKEWCLEGQKKPESEDLGIKKPVIF